MTEKLYNLMDWPDIEGIVYSEEDRPDKILGPHISTSGIIIQCFVPGAKEVTIVKKSPKKEYPMELADEAGFFAVLIPGKKLFEYELKIEMEDGTQIVRRDPYAYPVTIDEDAIKAFNAGVNYDIYRILGAHVVEVEGAVGTRFAVWAPGALRVSVVGDFNDWDGRVYPMIRREGGVFELFVPDVLDGDKYSFEIKNKSGIAFVKTDPYGFYFDEEDRFVPVICNTSGYEWDDDKWLDKKWRNIEKEVPISILEIDLGSMFKDFKDKMTYEELAPLVIEYVKKMNYTHIELMPLCEYFLDESEGYRTTGYFAPTNRYGTPMQFMKFVEELHKADIGVIMDWVCGQFPKNEEGLAWYDGTNLYEYSDPRIGEHREWNTLVFDYGRNEVKNFLIGSALYFIEEFHLDGLRFTNLDTMLYRDYGRGIGEWTPNIYGGNEHLEAVEFLKHLNSILKKRNLDAFVIAKEDGAWPRVTGDVDNGALGFDYKWNSSYVKDIIEFMKLDPLYRKYHYSELIFSLIYAYSERFVLAFNHNDLNNEKGSLLEKMPGSTLAFKMANLRALYGYTYMHPGIKMTFMGEDFAANGWNPMKELDWSLLEIDEHKKFNHYISCLNKFYRDNKPLYELDYVSDGFEWINNISANEVICVFLRKATSGDLLLVVANFTPVARANYKIGVPFEGKYKEIFSSDLEEFGGNGYVNKRVKYSKKDECDGREDSIRITVPPLGITVFKCTRAKEGKE